MIICKLIGGLGNQMFQYAFTYNLSAELKDDFCFDISFYKGNIPSIFNLNISNNKICNNTNNISSQKINEFTYHSVQKLIRTLNHERIGNEIYNYYMKKGLYYNFDPFYYPLIKSYKINKYVYGYFQSELYFKNTRDIICNQLTINEFSSKDIAILNSQIQKNNSVAIHFRFGDYCKKRNAYLNVCTDEYYKSAIDYMIKSVQSPIFYVFSDNIDLAKQKWYLPSDSIFVDIGKDYDNLMLMSNCKHFILANSSLSWWSSYLCKNPDKVVLVPDIWMKTLKEDAAIYRQDMIKICSHVK